MPDFTGLCIDQPVCESVLGMRPEKFSNEGLEWQVVVNTAISPQQNVGSESALENIAKSKV